MFSYGYTKKAIVRKVTASQVAWIGLSNCGVDGPEMTLKPILLLRLLSITTIKVTLPNINELNVYCPVVC